MATRRRASSSRERSASASLDAAARAVEPDPAAPRIAVVEDDPAVQGTIVEALSEAGFVPTGYATGAGALAGIREGVPDLVLLDLLLPGMHGLEVCRRIRSDPVTHGLPVVMLTALATEEDVVRGYEAGADDYVTKPWSPRTLVLKLRAVIGRTRSLLTDRAIARGPLSLDPRLREATLDGVPLVLSPSEFRILYRLASNPGWVLSRVDLHGPNEEDLEQASRTIDTRVFSLRKKLGAHADLIATVRGAGYRFSPSPTGGPGSGP